MSDSQRELLQKYKINNCKCLVSSDYPSNYKLYVRNKIKMSILAYMAYKEKNISTTKISSEKNDLHDDMDDTITDDNMVLEETDIPGTMVLKPAKQCSVAILKRWLLCFGAKYLGERASLFKGKCCNKWSIFVVCWL